MARGKAKNEEVKQNTLEKFHNDIDYQRHREVEAALKANPTLINESVTTLFFPHFYSHKSNRCIHLFYVAQSILFFFLFHLFSCWKF